MCIFDGPNGQLEPDINEKASGVITKCEDAVKAHRSGDRCPICQQGVLDYDGLLNLACAKCGAVVNTGGAFT